MKRRRQRLLCQLSMRRHQRPRKNPWARCRANHHRRNCRRYGGRRVGRFGSEVAAKSLQCVVSCSESKWWCGLLWDLWCFPPVGRSESIGSELSNSENPSKQDVMSVSEIDSDVAMLRSQREDTEKRGQQCQRHQVRHRHLDNGIKGCIVRAPNQPQIHQPQKP